MPVLDQLLAGHVARNHRTDPLELNLELGEGHGDLSQLGDVKLTWVGHVAQIYGCLLQGSRCGRPVAKRAAPF